MSDTNDPGGGPGEGAARRYTRRLSDKVLVAFHQACDQNDVEAAQELLHILEALLERKPAHSFQGRRKNVESLVAAHERLWHLRNPKAGG